MSKIGNTIKTALSSIGAKIKNFFTNLRTKIKSWSDNIKNKFKNRTPKNNIVSNSDVQTQKDNSRVQTRDNNVLQPQENMYVYKPTDNSVDNNINVDEQEENQQTDSNEDNQNTTIQTEKIQKIQINEEVGTVEYTTVDENKYTVDINRVLDNKKAIYKDFSISKKCKDLTGSFIKGRRLEKSLNSLVINGLNNDEDIDKYINCVNSEEKLFFDLEHNTQNSKLGFFDRNNMKKIAEIEQKLGADVQIEPGFFSKIKTQFSELFRKEDTEKENEEKMIAKQYKDAFKMLKNKAINSLYESKEYAKIEGNLEKCANWYMNNGNFKKADKCIETLSGMLKEQNQNYYGPKYKEEANKNNTEYAMENYAQMYWIKGTKIEKLKIKSSLLKGNENEAKRMYSSLLTRLGVSLTTEEFEQSIKNGGLLNGTYSYLKAEQIQNADGTISFNNKFVDVPIIGNEKILQDLEKYKNHKKSGSIITNTVKTEPQINNNEQQQNNNLIKAEEINMEEENSATTQNIANEEDSESIKIATEKRNEILAIIDKNNKYSEKIKYQKGIITAVIQNLTQYLAKNEDNDVKRYLNDILGQVEAINAYDLINKKQGASSQYNVIVLDYLSQIYKEGIKAVDGQEIIPQNQRKYGYYTYLLNRRLKALKTNTTALSDERIAEIEQEYLQNKQEFDANYYDTIKEQFEHTTGSGIDKLIAESRFFREVSKGIGISNENSDYLNLAVAMERLSRVDNKSNNESFQKIKKSIVNKIKNGEYVDQRTLELLGNIYYKGVNKNGLNETIVNPSITSAEKVYTYLLSQNKDTLSSTAYNRLLKIYGDNTLPTYNPDKAKQIQNTMQQNGVILEKEESKKDETQTGPYTYVCSDIHGDYAVYQAIINQLKDNDKLYIIGDAIDDGIEVLQDIMKRQEKGQVEFLIGNHEAALLWYDIFKELDDNPSLEEIEYAHKSRNNITYQSTFNALKSLDSKERNRIKQFLLNSLAYKQINIKDKEIFLVHAKAPDDSEKEYETVREILDTGRKSTLSEIVQARVETGEYKENDIQRNGIFTIVGHTPQENGIRYNDCGALFIESYYAKPLIRLEDGEVIYFDYETERRKMSEKVSSIR